MRLLITGGAGYIGSHVCVSLVEAGHFPVIVDNFSRSERTTISRLKLLLGDKFEVMEADVRDENSLRAIFASAAPAAILHFAAFKSVYEAVRDPLLYYDNNIGGTTNLLNLALEFKVNKFIFSSSATVYGDARIVPTPESEPLNPTNAYGHSKMFCEQILADICASNPDFSSVALRYFNPIGAHESGLIGDSPIGIPDNLLPYIADVAQAVRPGLTIFGDDYDTIDGTPARDYIHVLDLADAHLKGLEWSCMNTGALGVNIGTGRAATVLEVVRSFSEVNNCSVPYTIGQRRPGDVPLSCADPTFAKTCLNWSSSRTLNDMCRDHWNWIQTGQK